MGAGDGYVRRHLICHPEKFGIGFFLSTELRSTHERHRQQNVSKKKHAVGKIKSLDYSTNAIHKTKIKDNK